MNQTACVGIYICSHFSISSFGGGPIPYQFSWQSTNSANVAKLFLPSLSMIETIAVEGSRVTASIGVRRDSERKKISAISSTVSSLMATMRGTRVVPGWSVRVEFMAV